MPNENVQASDINGPKRKRWIPELVCRKWHERGYDVISFSFYFESISKMSARLRNYIYLFLLVHLSVISTFLRIQNNYTNISNSSRLLFKMPSIMSTLRIIAAASITFSSLALGTNVAPNDPS
jgi:hypothetical protein